MSKIIIMRGPSGSGKSTLAKEMVRSSKDKVRISRDDIRMGCYETSKTHRAFENFTIDAQRAIAAVALSNKMTPIIDDINLNQKTVDGWFRFAEKHNALCEILDVKSDISTCICNDSKRSGKARVGAPVIYRQFVEAGLFKFPSDRKLILVDIDGTLAFNDGHRSFYDESKVLFDKTHPVVCEWVRQLSVDYTIVICSGRHADCGYDTVKWLETNQIPYDCILMRESWMNDPDYLAKQRILDAILKCVPKEQIAFVLDDRQQVIFQCWKKNGLTVYPVRGLGEDTNF